MTLFHSGAKVCATALLLILLAGCGNQHSILSPTDTRLASGLAAQSVDTDARPGPFDRPPALTLFNSDFRYSYREGSYTSDPASWIRLDIVAGESFSVNWTARTPGSSRVSFYRWTLDIEDLTDNTPRLDEATDVTHWSQPSLSTTTATAGPFAAGEQHFLYVEVSDTRGVKSLATLLLTVVN